jgi:hypothetical protein
MCLNVYLNLNTQYELKLNLLLVKLYWYSVTESQNTLTLRNTKVQAENKNWIKHEGIKIVNLSL